MLTTKQVLIASEYSHLRKLLARVVEDERGLAVIGQAANQVEAMRLAREKKPDIVILDPHLPHVTGLDSVRLSRINGLDAAQAISSELPNTRVMVLTDSGGAAGQRSDTPDENGGGMPMRRVTTTIPVTLLRRGAESALPNSPVFIDLNSRGPEKFFRIGKRGTYAKLAWGVVLSLLGAWMLTGAVLFVLFIMRRLLG
jgi:CheY-like chemotaxis protein